MYRVAQKKDISFKKIEVVMRSAAFDCALTYKRNLVIGRAGTRDCNYSNCDYKCIGIPEKSYQKDGSVSAKDLDYSTYQLYYSDEKVRGLTSGIVMLFRTNFILSLQDIKDNVPTDNEFELLTALDMIISNSVPVHNKYGFISYLQEDNDMYFLVDGLSTIGSSSMAYYTKYPNVRTKQSFASIKEKYFTDVALPKAIKDLCATKGDIVPHIRRLPIEYREMFLENSVKVEILQERGVHFHKPQIRLARLILKYFDSDIHKIAGTKLIVSSLVYTHGGTLRCLDTTGIVTNPDALKWHDCSVKEEGVYTKGKTARRHVLEKEPFYGQINRKAGRFCIRDCSKTIEVEIEGKTALFNSCDPKLQGHLQTAGAQCDSYKVWDLTLISTFYTEMPVPPTDKTVEFILNHGCGPPKDMKGAADNGKFKPQQQHKIKKKLVDGKIEIGSGSSVIKIPNNEKALRTFLLKCANDVKTKGKKGKVNPAVAKKWFNDKESLFQYIVTLGDKKVKDPWRNLNAGIKKMSLAQMQRMVFYGRLAKKPLCAFICSWFNDNNLLVNENQCGSGNKKKYKAKSKKG